MKNDRHILGRSTAILARQKIASDHFHSCPHAAAAGDGFETCHVTGGPGEADQVAESVIQKALYQSGSNEAGCPCYQDRIVRPDYKSVAFHLAHILLLIGDVWLSYRVDAQERKEPAYVIKEFN